MEGGYCFSKLNNLIHQFMQRNNATLNQLRAFAAVADKRSFVGAAEVLHRSQPALSQCIKQLEQEVGSPLFRRTTRSVHLTVLGISFLPHVRHLLAQFDKVMDDARDVATRKRGRVVIACLPSVAYRLMPRVIAMNERDYPGIRITVRDINRNAVIAAVSSGEADMGIGSLRRSRPRAGDGLELAGQRQRFRQFDDLHWFWRVRLQHGLLRRVVVGDFRRRRG